MLRHFSTRCCNLLWKRTFLTSMNKPVFGIRPYRESILISHLCTGNPLRKDGFGIKEDLPGEKEALDLDKWKSVMRSQAAFQEQHLTREVETSEDDGDLEDAGDDVKGSSSLDATRELVSMWRQAGRLVPQEMTEEEVQTLTDLTTKSSRKKYLKYLAIKEGHKLARKEKQQQKKADREALMKESEMLDSSTEVEGDQDGHKIKNTMFLQFWDRSLDKLLAWRTAQAMQFGQPIVFDMSYESNMSRREMENTVSQLLEVEGWNRRAVEPFHLHFCNLHPGGLYKKELLKRYGAETWDRLLITSTEQQYIDVFPREELVYLTADSPNVLHRFDHSKVYIIGALVDRSIQSGLSLANAKRLKLTTARLPLDQFLYWDMGAKNLTLDQMIRIMLTIKDTGKWEEALQFVPKRKHDGFYQKQTKTEVLNNRPRTLKNHKPRQNADVFLDTEGKDTGRIFKKQTMNTFSNDRMTGKNSTSKSSPAATKLRTSFKSHMETRKAPDKSKMWWRDK
ncbi:tRNA methyltransferase 10 homolog C [Girardinichthys multiradiatus]|uniref:tRNA methyltransferase 10 homolog C n=1 Tax=Girardinichthys multiradiatus TaxID=208333 RepID=UPI001FAD14EC|nr:tRNA methyltransferase 10 homolog C [Girardinichthys multiradiatus]